MRSAARTHAGQGNTTEAKSADNDTVTASTAGGGGLSTSSSAASAATIRAAVRVRPLVDTETGGTEGTSGSAEVIRVVTAAGRLTRPLESAYTLEVLQPDPSSRTAFGAPPRGGRGGAAAAKATSYAFDVCAGPSTTQEELFDQLEIPTLCEAALAGQVVTVFCFGQTGSGKTYTLSGRTLNESEVEGPEGPLVSEDGLQYQAAAYVARRLREMRHAGRRRSRHHHHRSSKGDSRHSREEEGDGEFAEAPGAVVAKCSIVELYQEALYDLLQPDSAEAVRCRWSATAQSFYVEGSLLVECRNADDFTLVLREGQRNRQRGSHALNRDSSRSHVVFTIFLEVRDGDRKSDDLPPPPLRQEEEKKGAQAGGIRYGRLVFVDLAGSERLKKSQSSSGAETGSINKSLFTLGRVLELLSAPETTPASSSQLPDASDGAAKPTPFIPYRSSVLTQLLMQSLDGHGRTLMVACVSPSALHRDESLRTLHYAQRARHIRTSPVVHVDAATQARMALEATVKALRAENALLRRALQLPRAGALTEEDVQRQMAQLRLGDAVPAPQASQELLAAGEAAKPPTAAARDRAKSSPVPLKPTAAAKAKAGATGAMPPGARVNKRVAASDAAPQRTAPSSRPSAPATPSPPPSSYSSAREAEKAPPAVADSDAGGGGGGGAVNILAMLDALPDTRPAPR